MFRRAIALNPNYATAYQWYAQMLADMGRADEAISFMERAVELDPLSPIINSNLGDLLEAAGRFDEAETRYRKVIEIDPSMPSSYDANRHAAGIRAQSLCGRCAAHGKGRGTGPGQPALAGFARQALPGPRRRRPSDSNDSCGPETLARRRVCAHSSPLSRTCIEANRRPRYRTRTGSWRSSRVTEMRCSCLATPT